MNLEFVQLLHKALASPLGIAVKTNDPIHLRKKLYAERKHVPDSTTLVFAISRTDPDNELWIMKNNVGQQEPSEEDPILP